MRLFIDALLFLDARAINSINPILTSKERYTNHHHSNITNDDEDTNNVHNSPKTRDGQNNNKDNAKNENNNNNNNNNRIGTTQRRYALDSNFNSFKTLALFAMSNRMMNSLGPWLPVCTTFMSSRSVRLFEEFCPTLQYTTRISLYDIDRGVFRKLFLDDQNNSKNNEDSPRDAGISGLGRYLKTFESFITSKTLSEFHLFSSMLYLQNLTLHETKISTAATNDLRGIPFLKNLSLRRCYFNEIVCSSTSTTNFNAFGSQGTEKIIPYDTSNFYRNLVVLEISQSKMTDEQFLHILVPRQYTVSSPASSSSSTATTILLSAQAFSILGKTLRELTLCDCINLSDKTCIEVIPKLKSLLGLDLSLSEEQTATFNTQWSMTTMAATMAAPDISLVCHSENCGLAAGGGLFFPPLDYGDHTDAFMFDSSPLSANSSVGHIFVSEFKRKSAMLVARSNITNVCSISPPYFSPNDVARIQGDDTFANGRANSFNNNADSDSPVCLLSAPAVVSDYGIRAILENLGHLNAINLQNRRLLSAAGFLDVLENISKTLDNENDNNTNNNDGDAAPPTPRRGGNDDSSPHKNLRLPALRQIILDGCFSINSARCLPRRVPGNPNPTSSPPPAAAINPWRTLSSALGPFLTTLSLAFSAISAADFQAGAFIGLYNLQELNLRGCLLLDADAITGFVSVQSSTSTGLATLPPSDLRRLDISLTRIPGNGVVMQRLKDFYKHSLEWLSMSNLDAFEEAEVFPILASGWRRLSYLDVSHAFNGQQLHGPVSARSHLMWKMIVADPNAFFANRESNNNNNSNNNNSNNNKNDHDTNTREILAEDASDADRNPATDILDILDLVKQSLHQNTHRFKIKGHSLCMFYSGTLCSSRVTRIHGFGGINGMFLLTSPRLLGIRDKQVKKSKHDHDADADVGGRRSPKDDDEFDDETFLQETLQVLILDGNTRVETLVPLHAFYNLRILSLRHTGVEQTEIDALMKQQEPGTAFPENERILPQVTVYLQ